MWNIFKKKVKTEPRDDYFREAFVRISNKVPAVGSVILKIGDKFYRCRQLG